jgi:hypothetical protein
MFLDMKGLEVSELISDDWEHKLAFLLDLTAYLNELNKKQQDENHLVH